MILPALTEATSPYFRPVKYSLFPPLGLATLAAYLDEDDEVTIEDEHVAPVFLDDEPDLVIIQVYITSARRAYEIADLYRRRGAYVCLGGLHVTSLPSEAAAHADSIFLGPGEETLPAFLADLRTGSARPVYRSTRMPLPAAVSPRRDLIDRRLYLVPNSLVVSRGCPHRCDFCYQDSFYPAGRGFLTQPVDAALAEIERLPGRHLYFLDDNLFADPHFARELFVGMHGMGRLFQAAGTVSMVLQPKLLEQAVDAGLRSLFVGFETLSQSSLEQHGKRHNQVTLYDRAVERLHDLGVMVNASFVFGFDTDQPDVFSQTVEWAVSRGIETATFHILTPYPGTRLYRRLARAGRILHHEWDLYDTRHAVFTPAGMSRQSLEQGYWRSYEQFYRWGSILRSVATKPGLRDRLRHLAYTGAWKKLEPLWNVIIRSRQVFRTVPMLESVLSGFGKPCRDDKDPQLNLRTRPVDLSMGS